MDSSDIPVGYSIFCLLHELIPIFCIRLDNYVAPNGNQYTDRDYPALEDAVSYPALEDAVSPQSKNKRKKRKVVDEKQEKKRKKRKVVDEKQEKKRKKRKTLREVVREVVEDRIYI